MYLVGEYAFRPSVNLLCGYEIVFTIVSRTR